MRRLNLVVLFLFCLGTTLVFGKNQSKKPNIIILLADDLGYGELGSYGQKEIKTPNIDRLAANGVRFTDFYSGTSVCSPSRAVLMTGQHTGHTSIRGNKGWTDLNKMGRIALEKTEVTLAEMLKGVGYQTAMIGKWHLGRPEDLSTWAGGRGFDYAVQEQWGISAEGQVLDERMHWINNRADSVFYDYNQYSCLDEFRTNFAIDYLEDKDDSKPFFLYMSFRSPHAHEFFLSKNEMYNEHQQDWPEIERRHAARITMLDQQVQRILDKLEKTGELENTFIFLTSDNGPQNENHHDYKFFQSSGGLKGFKRDVYEGGVRIPAIAYWKGNIKPQESNHVAAFYDVMPTLADLVGFDAPSQTDGISFLPTLLGKNQAKHDFLYWEIQEGSSVKGFRQGCRIGNWKAVRYADKHKTEIYDLNADRFERKNVAKNHPEIVKQANKILRQESEITPRYKYSGGVWKDSELKILTQNED